MKTREDLSRADRRSVIAVPVVVTGFASELLGEAVARHDTGAVVGSACGVAVGLVVTLIMVCLIVR